MGQLCSKGVNTKKNKSKGKVPEFKSLNHKTNEIQSDSILNNKSPNNHQNIILQKANSDLFTIKEESSLMPSRNDSYKQLGQDKLVDAYLSLSNYLNSSNNSKESEKSKLLYSEFKKENDYYVVEVTGEFN